MKDYITIKELDRELMLVIILGTFSGFILGCFFI